MSYDEDMFGNDDNYYRHSLDMASLSNGEILRGAEDIGYTSRDYGKSLDNTDAVQKYFLNRLEKPTAPYNSGFLSVPAKGALEKFSEKLEDSTPSAMQKVSQVAKSVADEHLIGALLTLIFILVIIIVVMQIMHTRKVYKIIKTMMKHMAHIKQT